MTEGYEIKREGGLVALAYPDDWWENPLGWCSIKERGRCDMASIEGVRMNDPGEVDCPKCDGSGEVEVEGAGVECPECEGYGERQAKTAAEWCRTYGARAAVPVSYNMATSQPWIRTVDWDELEDACSILYLDGNEGDAEVIEGQITDLSLALEYGYSVVAVEVDPDGDLPEDALDGCLEVSLGECLGPVDDTADELLEAALEYVKRERAEREEWAKRGVLTK